MGSTLPDRFFTPRTARAVTAGTFAAVAVFSVGLLAGLAAVAAAVAIALLVWLGAMAVGVVAAQERRERIDPFTLGEPWRHFVRDALQAQARYGRAASTAAPGPLRDRLLDIGTRIDDGVKESWRIAKRGDDLDDALRHVDVSQIERRLAAAEHDTTALPGTADALRAQAQSAERLQRTAAGARDQLRLLNARLDEAVARAIELAAGTAGTTQLGGLGSDVDALVDEMEALRQALEETGGPTALPGPS